ncbi:MAG: beta-ketoacyl-ACP synthase II [Chitinophagaceae bacterium]|nr:beta-ketoacyl-ACP synthase II [Chitinophagaceae bacterium]
MEFKRVVVTGLGALTPLGNTVPEFWDNLRKGVSGGGPLTYFDTSKFKTKIACQLKNLDIYRFLEKKEARKLDPYSQYALIAAEEAVTDSGLDLAIEDKTRIGVIWATGVGGIDSYAKAMMEYCAGDGTPRFSPFLIPLIIPDLAAGHLSIKYGFMGPNMSIVNACASSTNSIIDALTYLRLGKAEVMLTGGSEFPLCIPAVGGFSSMKALSERNDSPETASRPYDKDRDGFVIGEGAGALVLEEYEHAKARGAKIYCEVIGGGMSGDAYHISAPHPEGIGVMQVLRETLKDAGGLRPEEVDYINTHGTSTPLGDLAELKAIKTVFGDHAYKMSISSTKSMTGHMLGAAGAAEAIACIGAMQQSFIPPTINHFTDDPEIDPNLDLTFNVAKSREVNVAMSNTFGFGGHNASLIMRKLKD